MSGLVSISRYGWRLSSDSSFAERGRFWCGRHMIHISLQHYLIIDTGNGPNKVSTPSAKLYLIGSFIAFRIFVSNLIWIDTICFRYIQIRHVFPQKIKGANPEDPSEMICIFTDAYKGEITRGTICKLYTSITSMSKNSTNDIRQRWEKLNKDGNTWRCGYVDSMHRH